MNSLRHFSLGTPFPESPHAVISCLPTMADVRGYEEHDPRVIQSLELGYPRFVCHRYIRRLIQFYLEQEGLPHHFAVLVSSRRAADDCLGHLGGELAKLEVATGVFLIHCPGDSAQVGELKRFVQHTGCGVSSRQAEDLLCSEALLDGHFEEATASGCVQSEVEEELAALIGCRASDVLVCASGMNAFYAGFRAVQEWMQSKSRSIWLQLGWLYLDSGKILEGFLGEGEALEHIFDVSDTERVIERIQALGDRLGAVVVECPSNPLVQICDLERIAAAVRAQGAVMMVDPTIASIYNVDVLGFSDLLVTSLTKYAAIEGDIMIGALAVNPVSPLYPDLILRTSSFHVPPYRREMARLAEEMRIAPDVIRRASSNAARLSAYLDAHPAVKKIHVARGSSRTQRIRKSDTGMGVVITIELNGSMEKFYDLVRVMKGPSFGTRFTVLSPFMYLAHYDLVTSDEGRAFLHGIGIHPELIRISVGEEPYEQIEAVFAEALKASREEA